MHKFFDGVHAVNDVSLQIHDRDFLVLLGPSGCGKTTLLRMIAGLEVPPPAIRIGEDFVNFVPPKDRDVAMVFQNYALYPHMDVADNITLGLRLRHTCRRRGDPPPPRSGDDLAAPGRLAAADASPLSGGQQQRVALGRSVVREPRSFSWTSRCRISTRGCASTHGRS